MIFKCHSVELCHIYCHLRECSNSFSPPLHKRVNIRNYSRKLLKYANNIECWNGDILVGLLCFYINDLDKRVFITNLSVLPEYKRQGVATGLLSRFFKNVEKRADRVFLEVSKSDNEAIAFYNKFDFIPNEDCTNSNKNMDFLILTRKIYRVHD